MTEFEVGNRPLAVGSVIVDHAIDHDLGCLSINTERIGRPNNDVGHLPRGKRAV